MLSRSSSICSRCTICLERQKLLSTAQHVARRFRSTQVSNTGPKRASLAWPGKKSGSSQSHGRLRNVYSPFSEPETKTDVFAIPPVALNPENCAKYFKDSVEEWANHNRTKERFQLWGFSPDKVKPMLDAYVDVALSDFFSAEENQNYYHLSRFSDSISSKASARQAEAEIIFSNIFFAWCHNTQHSKILDEGVSHGKIDAEVLASIRHLAEVADRRPEEEYRLARQTHRKIIMHVGPTNSGKTHHALRALAAAETGVYAGPLRLLAHEIWERLNLGQIVPLGVDQPIPQIVTQSSSALKSLKDQPIAAQAQKLGNPLYARKTNMITGEEKKIVDEKAGLYSCTVEMLSYARSFDVAVVDEIQLIGDPNRGFGWTAAVLGLCAKEVHLCGEESAIPVVQKLLEQTGDELEIRRYERLTPLAVEERSLGETYSKMQKGDCVVAFSRSRIFAIKGEIERKTGLRCAVVYGKLPPEVRSEQAALFNDPNSDYDVIIGSDAIGMGLNLKIGRIIFDTTSKPDGLKRRVTLAASQIKQIAGRAGRYGHSLQGQAPGGYCTTLYEKDLPVLRDALLQPFTPIPYAHIATTSESLERIVTALPSDTTSEAVQMAHLYAGNLPPIYRYSLPARIADICAWVDSRSQGLTWAEKQVLYVAPVAWRDNLCLQAAEQMIKVHRERFNVTIGDIIQPFKFMDCLEFVERQMRKSKQREKGYDVTPKEVKLDVLSILESFHKVLVLYMWMFFRSPVTYHDKVRVENLKHRVELVLDWGLQQLGRKDLKTSKKSKVVVKEVKEEGVKIEDKSKQTQTTKIKTKTIQTPRSRPLSPSIPLSNQFMDDLVEDYAMEPIIPSSSSSSSKTEIPITSNKKKTSEIAYTTETKDKYDRIFTNAPNLSTMLSKYVDSPLLKVSGGLYGNGKGKGNGNGKDTTTRST